MDLVASVSKRVLLDAGPLVITLAMRNGLKDIGIYFK
jgi:hypothetical protein